MSKFHLILKNIFLYPGHGNGAEGETVRYGRIFVVSAYGGVTDLLLENKKNGASGIYKKFAQGDTQWETDVDALLHHLQTINSGFKSLGLDIEKANHFLHERVEGMRDCLKNFESIFSYGHFDLAQYLPAIREMVSSLGEAHSAYNTVEILRAHGVNSRFIDLTGFRESKSVGLDDMIAGAFESINVWTEMPIVTGYVKCIEGIMNSFDRGYSEITFSKVTTITRAEKGIIHKEYHLSTADPQLVGEQKVRVIGSTNFDVADQLADIGMEAIHPQAAKGMEKDNIPICIKNAFEPEHPGTMIKSNQFVQPLPKVEMIAGMKNIIAVELWDPDMVGQSGYDFQVLEHFKQFKISYIAKSTNANTITHYLSGKVRNLEPCLQGLRKSFGSANIDLKEVSIVSVIGSNLRTSKLAGFALTSLYEAGIIVLGCGHCMRRVNFQIVVERPCFERTVRLLHEKLIEEPFVLD